VSDGALIDALRGVVGDAHVLVDPELRAGYETDWTGRFSGSACCVVRPAATGEVVGVLGACERAGVGVVAQGGNTGLVGGGVPRAGEVLLSTRRLDRVGTVDRANGEVVVGAGTPLVAVRDVARAAGWDVGVDLASRDAATIGGMVATNAGGEHVARYGPMRHQVVGVEAVLADGRVVGRVPALRKDNTGYAWGAVLAGSEGTLAVITAVHLALVPLLQDRCVALVALDGVAAAVALAGAVRAELESVLAVEVMLADGLRRVCAHTGLAPPFGREWPVVLLVELGSTHDVEGDAVRLGALLDASDAVRDSAVATDEPGRRKLWEYRDRHAEAINAAGVPHKLDVTLPHDRLAEFAAVVGSEVGALAPRAEVVLFGHLGDGNLHVNVLGLAPDDARVDHAVLGLVASMGGSISAEHGIGVAKRADLLLSRSAGDVAAMWDVKRALDPSGLLNPGVLFAETATGSEQGEQ
jgi:FAD/FMN-containing dehydrogenase